MINTNKTQKTDSHALLYGVVESLKKRKPLEFHDWRKSLGYEKIRGCYRKSDMIIIWANQVEKEYRDYYRSFF